MVWEVVIGQPSQPAGVANTYILTEKDGFPGNNYVQAFAQSASGKIYAKDFFGTLHLTGNNFFRYIPNLNNLSNGVNLLLRPNDELWLSEYNHSIDIVKEDRVLFQTTHNLVHSILVDRQDKGSRLFSLQFLEKEIVLYEFIGYKWKAVANISNFNQIKIKDVKSCFTFSNKFFVAVPGVLKAQKIYIIDFINSNYVYEGQVPEEMQWQYFNYFYGMSGEQTKLEKKKLEAILESLTGNFIPLNPKTFNQYFQLLNPAVSGLMYSTMNGIYSYFEMNDNGQDPVMITFETKEKINKIVRNYYYPFITVLTGNKPLRVFYNIKKYPRIFSHDNSNSVFSLVQDDQGQIWAGNYQFRLSVLGSTKKNKEVAVLYNNNKEPFSFMNAGLSYDGKIYLVGEGDGGILKYESWNHRTKLKPQLPTGFYLYHAPKGNRVYYPTAAIGYPVYYCDTSEIDKPTVSWKVLDSTIGIQPFGMATITEDSMGRIWMGHPKKGFAVYDPVRHKAISFDARKNETPFGFISSLTDDRGTVWMGGDNGLWYYNDYKSIPSPKSARRINHPILNETKRITSLAIYKNWLLMGYYDKICLLNLDSFYHKRKILLRYLNPQEAALTSYTEQNTLLVSNKDSTVWFSTSDMLYQWNIARWMQTPVYKVKMDTFLKVDSSRTDLSEVKAVKLKPGQNSFDIAFQYLSPDCLPRFTRTAFLQAGEKLQFTLVGNESSFTYKNLHDGLYHFYIEVFEQDGSTSRYKYNIIINPYLWERWWFWLMVSSAFFVPVVFWFIASKKRAIQEKELSHLNLVSLSSQFRPHFILNALNTIGADMKDYPDAERILSRLGESINLIFNQSLQKRVFHSLKNEWILVENVIKIHQIMYIPDLEYSCKGKTILEKHSQLNLPLGIVETHVENALLHGLRNKSSAPYILSIEITDESEFLVLKISDNGIGREAVKMLKSYKTNGTGTKNLAQIISILNVLNHRKIEITYVDHPANSTGTTVIVRIPKEYHYEFTPNIKN